MQKSDLLWSLYISERDFVRHHEEQRTAASNILAAIAAGLIVALGTEQLITPIEIGICVGLIAMGRFGERFCRKLSERMALHQARSYSYLTELDQLIGEVDIAKHKAEVNAAHEEKHPVYAKIRLRALWYHFHRAIFLFGCAALAGYSVKGVIELYNWYY